MRPIIITALVLCGCAESDPSSGDGRMPKPQDEEISTAMPLIAEQAEPECVPPIETEGPCTLACFPDLLIDTYVPEGLCVVESCTMPDGTEIRVGGCNL